MLINSRVVRKCQTSGELVFILKDTDDNIFGGFFSAHLELQDDYYGTGESFLFKLSVR